MTRDSHVEGIFQAAEMHAARMEWDAARKAYLEVVGVAPDHLAALLQLSYVESLSGSYRKAVAWTRRAAALRPRRGELAVSLARRLRTFNCVPELQALARDTLEVADVLVLVECALQLSNLNDHDLALACARAAVAASPDSIPARMVRGQMLSQHGQSDAARLDYEWVLQRAPRAAAVWWWLARLNRQSAEDNHVAALRRLLSAHMGPTDRAAAGFALHKELDDLGQTEEAWRALSEACAAKRSTLQYSPQTTNALFDGLIAMPLPSRGSLEHPAGPVPVFIVGMHRSGTTLLEQLLDGSPDVRGIGELYDFTSAMRHGTDHHCRGVIDETIVARAPNVDFEEVARCYLQGVGWRVGSHSHFTDKLPSNFLNIGFICTALPHARILHMVRDPMETCFSNLRELFSDANAYSYDQRELAAYYGEYRRLMRHWQGRFPGRILEVDYADLTRDPAATMREVAAFCGIPYEEGMSSTRTSARAVSTASAMQVRSEVYRPATAKWKPYERQLQPLMEALRAQGDIG